MKTVSFYYSGLFFRSYLATDAEIMTGWTRDGTTSTFFELQEGLTAEAIADLIRLVREAEDRIGLMVVDSGVEIGIAEITDIDNQLKDAVIGVALGPPARQNFGYAHKIMEGLIWFCTESYGLKTLKCRINSESKRMLGIAYSFGFEKEREYIIWKGGASTYITTAAYSSDQEREASGSHLELIGGTPCIRLNPKKWETQGNLYAKVDSFSPSNNAEGRIARRALEAAVKAGEVNPATTIIAATGTSLGMSFAKTCALYGLPLVAVLPRGAMPQEERGRLEAAGGMLVETPREYAFQGAAQYAEFLRGNIANSFLVNEGELRATASAYIESEESDNRSASSLDTVILCLGPKATLTGVVKNLSRYPKNVKVYAVELETNATSGHAPPDDGHARAGTGILPQVLKTELLDGIMLTPDHEASAYVSLLAGNEGLHCGISSGAALSVAVKYCNDNPHENVLVVLPDNEVEHIRREPRDGSLEALLGAGLKGSELPQCIGLAEWCRLFPDGLRTPVLMA